MTTTTTKQVILLGWSITVSEATTPDPDGVDTDLFFAGPAGGAVAAVAGIAAVVALVAEALAQVAGV